MSKRLIFLISFVLVLSLCSNALAEDLNPPYWASAPDSWYTIYEFNPEEVTFGGSEEGWTYFLADPTEIGGPLTEEAGWEISEFAPGGGDPEVIDGKAVFMG